MATTIMNVSVDQDIQTRAARIFEQLGLDMSTAVNMFLRQTVLHQDIPFSAAVEPEKAERKPVKLGGWEGKIWIADDFDAPLDDFKEYM